MRLFLLLVFFVGTSFSGPRVKVIDKGFFKVGYSEEWQQPVWVEYQVACINTIYSRKGLDFYPEPGVQTSDDLDYTANEWDKGHMAPAADFACDSLALRATFSYLNCALQQENLNRGVWRYLEAHERQLAASGPVEVRIDVLFTKESIKLASGARVPSSFRKTIKFNGEKKVYEFPNQRPRSSDPAIYLIK